MYAGSGTKYLQFFLFVYRFFDYYIPLGEGVNFHSYFQKYKFYYVHKLVPCKFKWTYAIYYSILKDSFDTYILHPTTSNKFPIVLEFKSVIYSTLDVFWDSKIW